MTTIRSNIDGRVALVACAALALALAGPPDVRGQEDSSMPRFPNGTTVVLVPVQSTLPLDDGSWPGMARTEEDALRAMDSGTTNTTATGKVRATGSA